MFFSYVARGPSTSRRKAGPMLSFPLFSTTTTTTSPANNNNSSNEHNNQPEGEPRKASLFERLAAAISPDRTPSSAESTPICSRRSSTRSVCDPESLRRSSSGPVLLTDDVAVSANGHSQMRHVDVNVSSVMTEGQGSEGSNPRRASSALSRHDSLKRRTGNSVKFKSDLPHSQSQPSFKHTNSGKSSAEPSKLAQSNSKKSSGDQSNSHRVVVVADVVGSPRNSAKLVLPFEKRRDVVCDEAQPELTKKNGSKKAPTHQSPASSNSNNSPSRVVSDDKLILPCDNVQSTSQSHSTSQSQSSSGKDSGGEDSTLKKNGNKNKKLVLPGELPPQSTSAHSLKHSSEQSSSSAQSAAKSLPSDSQSSSPSTPSHGKASRPQSLVAAAASPSPALKSGKKSPARSSFLFKNNSSNSTPTTSPVRTSFKVKSPSTSSAEHEDAQSEAVKFLGQLKHHEDCLVDWLKLLAKRDPRRLRDIFTCVVEGWTCMHACTLRGARKHLKLALKAGVSPDLEMGLLEDIPSRCSPLHLAAHRGDVSVLQLLVQHGATVNKPDGDGKTPLYYAVNRNNALAARKLIKYGADFSDLTHEQRIYYKEDIEGRPGSLLCIPVRTPRGTNLLGSGNSSKQ